MEMEMEMVADVDNGTISNYLPPSISAASSIFLLTRFRATKLNRRFSSRVRHARTRYIYCALLAFPVALWCQHSQYYCTRYCGGEDKFKARFGQNVTTRTLSGTENVYKYHWLKRFISPGAKIIL
jgi:hypothetical protein